MPGFDPIVHVLLNDDVARMHGRGDLRCPSCHYSTADTGMTL